MSEDETCAAIERADAMGLPIAAHAIGDRAVNSVLNALERVRPGSRGHRIEHAELIAWDDIERIVKLRDEVGLKISVQPCHLLVDVEALHRAVPDRRERVLPVRALIEAGLKPGVDLLFGSDTPIVHPRHEDSIQAATLRRRDDSAAIGPEPAIDRIMEKTNDALETPESGRKREAISHLKAAVAATEADRKMRGVEEESEDQTESYREDLAQVVRPKRATAIATARVRPRRPTSPLKLVAEQRVDTESAAPAASAAPVRPRRISKTPAVAAETDGGFAEFAESAGARELPDLLEAAAAYTAYVEGRENFTRPQVLRRAAAVAGKDGFSREDGLRSFGQLLREGKINKLNRGQFVVSEETRFRPNARIAGE